MTGREKFEAWAMSNTSIARYDMLRRLRDGTYHYAAVEGAWAAWQAAYAAGQEAMREKAVEAIKDSCHPDGHENTSDEWIDGLEQALANVSALEIDKYESAKLVGGV